MDHAPLDPFDPCPASVPRFSLGKGAGSLAACLWFWTSVGALATLAPEAAPSTPYKQALASFNQRNYERALGLLGQTPADVSSGERADAQNLRGAIYLRQGRFEQARAAFAEAVRLDPGFWAARFNAGEVTFRQGDYAESRNQFDALLDRTSRIFHPEERRFLEYKVLLADLCAGREQPALTFIVEHRADPVQPLAWYYLNAALEQRHDRPQKAEQWLAQADAKPIPDNREPYAASFEHLARPDPSVGFARSIAARQNRRSDGGAPASSARGGSALRDRADALAQATRQAGTPATVAVVQVLPQTSVADDKVVVNSTDTPVFRTGTPPAPEGLEEASNVPPGGLGFFPRRDESYGGKFPAEAGVLAKPRNPRGGKTPTPTPAPSATPTPESDGSTQNQGGGTTSATPAPSVSPSPTVSPAGSPSPEFMQKYEEAYAKFIARDYAATLTLLDEADKIQPKQAQTATLRAQVFKQDYEAAYLAFRKMDYPAALAKLDEADQAQPGYPDALNLRGLVYSKQRLYDRAETMFKRAVEADPTLWAAKFNYAELPFNRTDYTTARGRFEDLLAETDAAKRPREAELTQYKVFLTLLMQGKTDQARSFMDHFNFSGATPAKYFCNAAMNFQAGTVDKAETWINSAKREYPAQLVSIFLESFYRLGWMTDPNTVGAGTAALAAASPTPAASPAVEAVAASVSPGPSSSPALVAATSPIPPAPMASATPTLLAASSPVASPAVVPVEAVGPSLAPTASPATVARPVASPAVTPGTPAPTATVRATPTAIASATPSPLATAVPTSSPKPTSTATGTPAPASPTPTATAAGTPAAENANSASNDILPWSLGAAVFLYGLYIVSNLLRASSRRKARRAALKAAARVERDEMANQP